MVDSSKIILSCKLQDTKGDQMLLPPPHSSLSTSAMHGAPDSHHSSA